MGITNRQRKYFEIAKAVSKLSDFHRQHLGCAVIYKRNLLSTGVNQTKSHTLQAQYNRHRDFDINIYPNSIHAEIDALSKIRYMDVDKSKVRLYIYRETANGELAMARPCKACMSFIKDMGIREIWYTTEDGYCCERIL